MDNRVHVLLVNNVSRKQHTPCTVHLFQVLSDAVAVHDEISVKKLFEFISVSKTGLLFKNFKKPFPSKIWTDLFCDFKRLV